MSSIFTFNHSPPKPASPWSGTPTSQTPDPTPDDPSIILDDIPGHLRSSLNSGRIRNSYLPTHTNPITDDSGNAISTLTSEPQIGSTEYKLSLSRGGKSEARLEQLTTQLLWRLQQSTAYHGTNSYTGTGGRSPGHLMDSQGALYEIGVADDGTLVGLDEAEMEESLEILRTMAAKLGAVVEILRRVYVRSVTQEDIDLAEKKLQDHVKAKLRARGKNHPRSAKKLKERDETLKLDQHEAEKFKIPALGTELWVVEALVKPGDATEMMRTPSADPDTPGFGGEELEEPQRPEELRVSLTGPTTAGKSSLLGTLTTGELDNGRGKSRLSLLRHRHELISGVTSSVAWEIFGFRPPAQHASEDTDDDGGFFGGADPAEDEETAAERLINYATPNVSSWTDIHSSTALGRLVFISDTAGHTKYRRTALRSLIGWAPHYVLLCIPGDAKELEEDAAWHLELCIKLGLRMIVVFTKIDVAGKDGLRAVFSGVLGKLKANNRRPVSLKDTASVKAVVSEISKDGHNIVPVVFTSSVRGDGGDLIRELLMRLPTVPEPLESSHSPLFHTEETFTLPSTDSSDSASPGVIVSGTLKYGTISLNDILTIGPFSSTSSSPPISGDPATTPPISEGASPSLLAPPTPHLIDPGSTSCSGTTDEDMSTDADAGTTSLSSRTQRRRRRRKSSHAAMTERTIATPVWRTVKVVSLRHLRLPVARLYAGEAGTIGLIPADDEGENGNIEPRKVLDQVPAESATSTGDAGEAAGEVPALPPLSTVRKGQVLLSPRPDTAAADGFAIELDVGEGVNDGELMQGMEVAVWVASLRASMRVLGVWRIMGGGKKVVVRLQFVKREMVEWVEEGERVLVLASGMGGKGMWVGKVVEEAG